MRKEITEDQLKQLLAGIPRAEEVNKLRAGIERLREALQESACACSSIRECASTWARQDECAHLTARKALEGKP
jgi:hypothetical protein